MTICCSNILLWLYIGIVASSYYPGRYVLWYFNSSSFVDIEEFEDNKRVIWIRISKKNRQHNGQKKKIQKDKQRSTKHTYKAKDLFVCNTFVSLNLYCSPLILYAIISGLTTSPKTELSSGVSDCYLTLIEHFSAIAWRK